MTPNIFSFLIFGCCLSRIQCQQQQQAFSAPINAQLFGIQTKAQWTDVQTVNQQVPVAWSALDILRGKTKLEADAIQELIQRAVPGSDYPIYSEIPTTRFSCESVHQPGFYADTEAQCQVIRRCDINGVQWTYLCPNATVFNQITLSCDWFFNVDCAQAAKFYDYSNPRLYHPERLLLDDQAGNSQTVPAFRAQGVNAGQKISTNQLPEQPGNAKIVDAFRSQGINAHQQTNTNQLSGGQGAIAGRGSPPQNQANQFNNAGQNANAQRPPPQQQTQFNQVNNAAQTINAQLFGIQTKAQWADVQTVNPQVPIIWSALDVLRGKTKLETDAIQEILARAVPGSDYPALNDVPFTRFSCESTHQPGFYADTEAQCQVIRRCDINGVMWSYLCPNATVFNQLTLTCDWFFNVDCSQAVKFYDYSNPRLYHADRVLLDDEPVARGGTSNQFTQGGGSFSQQGGNNNQGGFRQGGNSAAQQGGQQQPGNGMQGNQGQQQQQGMQQDAQNQGFQEQRQQGR